MDANFFKARREQLGLTQRQVAEAVGRTPQAVSEWESDANSPSIKLVPGLAKVYGISEAALLRAIMAQQTRERVPA